jgi:hypothetical protein
MNDRFERRVHAAAVATWQTALIAVLFIVLQWLVYLAVIHARPDWVQAMWPGYTWESIQIVWFWAIAAMKFLVWLLVIVALWLTIWAKQLRKHITK